MSRLPDEQWDMIEDSINKKRTAQSARHCRTHCGKSGSVKFPSDYMTKKELQQMNSECKSYRLNDTMSWKNFKELPDDLKRDYIKLIRNKYNSPDSDIAAMMKVNKATFSKLMKALGLSVGKRVGLKSDLWRKSEQGVAFYKWCQSRVWLINPEKIGLAIEEDQQTVSTVTGVNSRPMSGSLVFECTLDEAMDTIHSIIQDNKVHLSIQWTLMKED